MTTEFVARFTESTDPTKTGAAVEGDSAGGKGPAHAATRLAIAHDRVARRACARGFVRPVFMLRVVLLTSIRPTP
jgi:hypothetical protein